MDGKGEGWKLKLSLCLGCLGWLEGAVGRALTLESKVKSAHCCPVFSPDHMNGQS